jgi:hypothetical protein
MHLGLTPPAGAPYSGDPSLFDQSDD